MQIEKINYFQLWFSEWGREIFPFFSLFFSYAEPLYANCNYDVPQKSAYSVGIGQHDESSSADSNGRGMKENYTNVFRNFSKR